MVKIGASKKYKLSKKRTFCGNRGEIPKCCGNREDIYKFCGNWGNTCICNMHWCLFLHALNLTVGLNASVRFL